MLHSTSLRHLAYADTYSCGLHAKLTDKIAGTTTKVSTHKPVVPLAPLISWMTRLGLAQALCCDSADVRQVGRDPRISGPLLAAALAAGLTSKGVRVARFGLATTPAMFMSCITAGVA